MKQLLAVVNGAAGTADDESGHEAVAGLRAVADVEMAATADPQGLERALAGRDDRRVVVVGGDGSVHAAVAALGRLGALDTASSLNPLRHRSCHVCRRCTCRFGVARLRR